MTRHVASVVPFRTLPAEPLVDATREALIQEMANHLYAGALGGLNTANDQDVISYLWNAPQRNHHRLVLDHMDDAMYLAKQMLVAAEMSEA
jgi:hypothetical protein